MPRIRKKPAARSHILRCARKSCKRTSTNVKNVPRKLLLAKIQADLQTCRALHSNCETLRFCSVSCLRQCKKSTRTGRRGARCGLNKQQLALMLKQGIQDDKPWLAILIFCQILCGERADCARRLQVGWLQDLSPDDPAPPRIEIPKVNGKTTARTVWLAQEHAQQLHGWLFKQPLQSKSQQWPHADLDLKDAETHLFPGWTQKPGQLQQLDSSKAISERNYLKALKTAGSHIAAERQKQPAGTEHAFDGFDFKRLGTHSFKRTAVSLLKDTCLSTSIVSAVTGTSSKTLDQYYDEPTASRQRKATGNAFSSLFDESQKEQPSKLSKQTTVAARFCTSCGTRREQETWMYCPNCGKELQPQSSNERSLAST